jgi:hypothetical protein
MAPTLLQMSQQVNLANVFASSRLTVSTQQQALRIVFVAAVFMLINYQVLTVCSTHHL